MSALRVHGSFAVAAMSTQFSAWAAAQHGISPLAKLLLLRLADAHAGCDGAIRWDPEWVTVFCCSGSAELNVAFDDLVDKGLVLWREGRFVLACSVR